MCIYIYIYTRMYVHMCIYIYIYMSLVRSAGARRSSGRGRGGPRNICPANITREFKDVLFEDVAFDDNT